MMTTSWTFTGGRARRKPLSLGSRSLATLVLALGPLAGIAQGQVINTFTIPTLGSEPEGIVTGPDGNLWFTEQVGNKVGRLSPAGVFTEFPVPTPASRPETITVGPDGNLWFTEQDGNKIGRITTDGVITEFPVPSVSGQPEGIATGPDGNLWFTEYLGNKISRITTAGVVTEFPVPTGSSGPEGAAAGPDGNVWFVEHIAGKVGRVTRAGVVTEFPIPTAGSNPWNITAGPDGNLWFSEGGSIRVGRVTPDGVVTEFSTGMTGTADYLAPGPDGNVWFSEYFNDRVARVTPAGVITEFLLETGPDERPYGIAPGPDGAMWFPEDVGNRIGRITTATATPAALEVDARSVTGSSSNANSVLESGETVQIDPSWKNTLVTTLDLTGTASNPTGPPGPTYALDDASADYGTVAANATADCDGATGDCYLLTVSGSRPAAHWDATVTETLSAASLTRVWKIHVGESFPDVPTTQQFYAPIENLFHNGITGGCAGGNYCPDASVTRAQMSVFLMKSKLGASASPPAASGTVFADVPASNPFAPWIEQLAGFQITGGCGGGLYCPSNPVTRAQMAVFLLKSEHGSAYVPPDCTGVFGDVDCPSNFANWIEQLAAEGITGGCGGGNYCPDNPNTRGQMAVFLVKTFGLQLYGP
jgi:streptogramin lyase